MLFEKDFLAEQLLNTFSSEDRACEVQGSDRVSLQANVLSACYRYDYKVYAHYHTFEVRTLNSPEDRRLRAVLPSTSICPLFSHY
jgi:hypothetical protein